MRLYKKPYNEYITFIMKFGKVTISEFNLQIKYNFFSQKIVFYF